MTEIPRPTSRDQFRIAIICALRVESEAVEAIFDEYYDENDNGFGQDPSDENVYRNGRIGNHYVVLVYMPGIGKCRAMTTTLHLKLSYPRIQQALVVGVCGGVPYGNDGRDIFLGDVLVSDRLVQWDTGTLLPGAFIHKDRPEYVQGRPCQRMETFLAKFKTPDETRRWETIMAEQLETVQRSVGEEGAAYPGVDQDRLYPSGHLHQHRDMRPCGKCRSCGGCEEGKICHKALISTCDELGCPDYADSCRTRQHGELNSTPKPALHLGPIASGDTVLMSGDARDQLAAKTGVTGIEMEGIGLWEETSCVVIKGIADYADCHKTKEWQRYAAASAASCTKALLLEYTMEPPQIYSPEKRTSRDRNSQAALSPGRLLFQSMLDFFAKVATVSTMSSISDTVKMIDVFHISSSLWTNFCMAALAFVIGYSPKFH
ncbi:putative Pfs domain protein [Aspergillus novofumigatus IBT 16806]|uniref:Purine and uridine phosphorylase n=1 Tax=Aspergillus novofumigatus (strain IBT 16806) TaxID=1392255 RepID=A0A2I1BXJ1_ASPN1|nr:purine and uridine phosphorylase [Aspergillus novofumigatus IBT 16806]PKX90096.1 purine and uridine phosphorylase [Aspergillus novofumigatus IBT 16806]